MVTGLRARRLTTVCAFVLLGAASPMNANNLIVSLVPHGPYRSSGPLAFDLKLTNPTNVPVTATLERSNVDVEGSETGPLVAAIYCPTPNAELGPAVPVSVPAHGEKTLENAVDLACHAHIVGSGKMHVRARAELTFPGTGGDAVHAEFVTDAIAVDIVNDAPGDPAAPSPAQHCLNVSGATLPAMSLLPTVICPARPSREVRAGDDVVQGLDQSGKVLFTSERFAPVRMPHPDRDQFTLPIPVDDHTFAALHALKFVAGGKSLTVTSRAPSEPNAIVQCIGGGNVLVSWLGVAYPALFIPISDGTIEALESNENIASFTMTTNDRSMDIQFSDGVKSMVKTVHAVDCP